MSHSLADLDGTTRAGIIYFMSILSAAVLFFLVMDPVGNVPMFVTALRTVDPTRHRRVVVRELLFALAVMVVFLFAGRFVLQVLQLSEPALTVAGGVLLFLIALRMIFPSDHTREDVAGEPFLVPLAVPYVAGPSLLATELLLMSREPERWASWLSALFLAWAVSAVIIYFASAMRRLLGERGLIAVERLMGMVLIAVAIQMLMTGIRVFFADWVRPGA